MLTGRLNVFQRLARTWDAAHPYNAGQACRVDGTFDAGALERAWNEGLDALGLGVVRVAGKRFSFHRVPSQPVRQLKTEADLSRHFTAELNRPFDAPDEPPFRPFAQRAGGSTWLGVVYQHWVADSFSIRLLLGEWLARLIQSPVTARQPRGGKRRMSPGGGASVLELMRRYGDFRRSRKVHTMGPLDYPVRVRLLRTLPGLIPGLLAYARRHDVKMNDVCLAALALACDRLVPAQLRAGRRDLALSSVVDLRPSLHSQATFGCHLGFRSVVCRGRDLVRVPLDSRDFPPAEAGGPVGLAPIQSNERSMASWSRLLRSIRSQRSASTGVAWMHAAEFASRFTPPTRIYDFYRKEAPFAGGISNVNLNGTAFASLHPATVLDYIRVSPTGPMAPVALNLTTLGDNLHMSMTYRTALFNDWTAGELAKTFIGKLADVAQPGVG